MPEKNKYIEHYNKNNTYKIGVSFNPKNGNIVTSLNDELIFTTTDLSFHGKRIGLMSQDKNTIFKQIIIDET